MEKGPMGASDRLVAAVEAVWILPPPGPENPFNSFAFKNLCAVCTSDYGAGNPRAAAFRYDR